MTRRACVIGYPVAHSRSPLIHGYWLREHKIDGDYVRHEVRPEAINSFLQNFASSGFIGCNVTLPHKEAAARNVKDASPVVRALGVANTLWLDNDALHADNSDVTGFVAHLDNSLPDWNEKTKHVVILGAGGAARAVIYGLKSRGVENITIVNRTPDRAAQLIKEINIAADIAAFDKLPALLAQTDLLVNTTSLGMKGQPSLEIDLKNLKAGAAVCDVVYVPLETELLKQAGERGHPAIDGLGMLLHQAVVGFERWFGVKPKVTPELRAHIVADLVKGDTK